MKHRLSFEKKKSSKEEMLAREQAANEQREQMLRRKQEKAADEERKRQQAMEKLAEEWHGPVIHAAYALAEGRETVFILQVKRVEKSSQVTRRYHQMAEGRKVWLIAGVVRCGAWRDGSATTGRRARHCLASS